MRLYLVLLLFVLSTPSYAETVKDAALERMLKAQKELDQFALQKNQELGKLRDLEVERFELETELDQLERSLNLSKSSFTSIEKINEQLRDKLSAQLELLEKITLLSYNQQKESALKIFLHVDDIDTWYQNLAYYRYTTAYQLSQSAQTDANIKIQETLLQELVQTKKTIERQQQILNERLTRLHQIKTDRKQILQTIGGRIIQEKQHLVQLQQQLTRIDKLADDIGNLQADEILVTQTNFASLRGSLQFPASGEVISTFGNTQPFNTAHNSTLHKKGVVIETDYGSPVSAIARGNIVFSDWLRGFGLVVIIDHGDSYLSLYAHNRKIVKQRGEWVEAGDVISLVGETGGRKKPELYFELRHKSVPLNPSSWFAS